MQLNNEISGHVVKRIKHFQSSNDPEQRIVAYHFINIQMDYHRGR